MVPIVLSVLAALAALLLSASKTPQPPVLIAAFGILLGAWASPLAGGGVVLLSVVLSGGRQRPPLLPLLLTGTGLLGAILLAVGGPIPSGLGASLVVTALAGLSLVPCPSLPVLPRLAGAGMLLLLVGPLAETRVAWWPLLMNAGFISMGLGAVRSLSPGRHWVQSAALSGTGLALLLGGLPGHEGAALVALIAVVLGELSAVLTERAGARDAWTGLCIASLGGLPVLGLWAWIDGLQVLHASGFGVVPGLAWPVLAIGTVRQLRSSQQPLPTAPSVPQRPQHIARMVGVAALVGASLAPLWLV
jgi:hypothetical protein